MFSYLRYFAVICLVLVVAGAAMLGYYFSELKRIELLEGHGKHTSASVSSYGASIWNRYAAELTANPASPYLPSFQAETKGFFDAQRIAKITIFSPDVKRLYYSANNSYVATDAGERVALFDLEKVKANQSVRRLIEDATLKDSADANTKRVMIQLIVPVTRPGMNTPDALAEVYLDVSEQWKQLQMLQYLIIGTMIGTFTLMVVLLIYTASRAESIITKQHEVNLELIAAASQAEAQSHDKSQFLASVSHELRTPLNAIIGFSEILRNEAKMSLQKVYQDYIDDIFASGKHLLSLINDILDYSKAEAGKLQVEWAETDATKIIRNSLRMVMPRAETAQVMLIEDIPQHHLVIVTDAKKLKQVLLNLLSNAVKFTPAGGEVRCQAWVEVATGKLMITVKDTGIGIAPKDISKVMTPFGQVESALSRKYEGTGLGLPLSKKFIETMGGEFGISSELGVGTTVTISIPKAPPTWAMNEFTNDTQSSEDGDVARTASTEEA